MAAGVRQAILVSLVTVVPLGFLAGGLWALQGHPTGLGVLFALVVGGLLMGIVEGG